METSISQLILEDREKRYNDIIDLIRKYNLPVLCGKLNYPGKDKNTVEANKAFEILNKIIKENFKFKTVFSKELKGYDGKSILAIIDMFPNDIKKLSVKIEESSKLGRIFDIDVYIEDGSSIGRETINMTPRGCIICGDNARICARSGKHNLEETLNKVNEIINNYGD